jgi:hypothetical protein
MSIFGAILEKLGVGRPHVGTPDIRPLPPKTAPAGGAAAISEADVVAQLEQRAAANPQQLYWRSSIVDLLKLLDMDSSLDERKALATELGAPAKVMADSASMNVWLHKEVLQRIGANGGKVPANLLD